MLVEALGYIVLLIMVVFFGYFDLYVLSKIFSFFIAIVLVLEATKKIPSVFLKKTWKADDFNISKSRFDNKSLL